MKARDISKLSLIADKMGLDMNEIGKLFSKNSNMTQLEAGTIFIGQIIPKLHFVDKEIIEFIMDKRNITKEEAEEVDIIEFFKNDLGDLKAFFK